MALTPMFSPIVLTFFVSSCLPLITHSTRGAQQQCIWTQKEPAIYILDICPCIYVNAQCRYTSGQSAVDMGNQQKRLFEVLGMVAKYLHPLTECYQAKQKL